MAVYHAVLTPVLIIFLFISAVLMSFERFFIIFIITLEHGYSSVILYSLFDTFRREYNYKVVPMKRIGVKSVKV
jgi:hypothetical protein